MPFQGRTKKLGEGRSYINFIYLIDRIFIGLGLSGKKRSGISDIE